jgi:hypothetical protein
MEPRIKFLQSLSLSREMPACDRSSPTPFNVLIIYEDCGTGKLAKKGLDYVIEELGNDLEFRHTMWRFDILQDPKLNLLATPALAEADLLIISFRGEEQLPAEIRVLIGTWLAEKSNCDCALQRCGRAGGAFIEIRLGVLIGLQAALNWSAAISKQVDGVTVEVAMLLEPRNRC